MMTPLLLAAALAAGTPATVDAALLAGLPAHDVTLTAHGVTQTCNGTEFAAVLAKLGLPQGEALRGPALARGVIVHARDGYAVLFSLGEVDAALGNDGAIIATRCEGKPLTDKDGPYRLIVPNDKRPARSVRQMATIELVGGAIAPAAFHNAH